MMYVDYGSLARFDCFWVGHRDKNPCRVPDLQRIEPARTLHRSRSFASASSPLTTGSHLLQDQGL